MLLCFCGGVWFCLKVKAHSVSRLKLQSLLSLCNSSCNLILFFVFTASIFLLFAFLFPLPCQGSISFALQVLAGRSLLLQSPTRVVGTVQLSV